MNCPECKKEVSEALLIDSSNRYELIEPTATIGRITPPKIIVRYRKDYYCNDCKLSFIVMKDVTCKIVKEE